jgi:hypothetical protein
MACAKVARRKGGISAKLRCTSRLSARMLIKIRKPRSSDESATECLACLE